MGLGSNISVTSLYLGLHTSLSLSPNFDLLPPVSVLELAGMGIRMPLGASVTQTPARISILPVGGQEGSSLSSGPPTIDLWLDS